MTIAFFSNYFNHHQKPLADALSSMEDVQYTFVATSKIPQFRLELGYQKLNADYVLDTTLSSENKQKALQLAVTVDVVIFSGNVEEYIIPRLKRKKMTFEYSERRLKKGILNILSPRLIKHQLMYFLYGHSSPLYLLCASAYAANDYNVLLSYKNRCFKWGYFTAVENFELEALTQDAPSLEITPLMWCSRFLSWKHPEIPVLLAARLKSKGYQFSLDMFGRGEKLEETKALAEKLDVLDVVHFCGNRPNDEILQEMRRHRIFLFTSDRHEGWGAVSNESMSNGCVLVGSDKIGSVPYLVKDGINGYIFKSQNLDSLEEKVLMLLNDPRKLLSMRKEAIRTMREVWSPTNAARCFITLVKDLSAGRGSSIKEGPCSKAKPYRNI